MRYRYDFSTNSDTEVIPVAVEVYGLRWFLDNADGMFALAIYDKEREEVYLARDRFGIKPLYIYNNEKILIFGSEIKAMLSFPFIDKKPFWEMIDLYLGYRYVLNIMLYLPILINFQSLIITL